MAAPAPRPDLGEMYEPEAVADALHIGRATVYRLIKSGELKASKIGRQYRIPAASLNEYLGLTEAA
jgi:putative molybdopterin biosynthesis protein